MKCRLAKELNIMLLAIVVAMAYPTIDFLLFPATSAPSRDWPELPTHEVYYDGHCTIPYLALGGDVETWLERLRWAEPYEVNKWDCSDRSSYLEWALENCGYRTEILAIPTHGWIRVWTGSGWRDYDVVYRDWVPEFWLVEARTQERYSQWSDIYEVYDAYGYHVLLLSVFTKEWAWWR